jgi:hypothetical protein
MCPVSMRTSRLIGSSPPETSAIEAVYRSDLSAVSAVKNKTSLNNPTASSWIQKKKNQSQN